LGSKIKKTALVLAILPTVYRTRPYFKSLRPWFNNRFPLFILRIYLINIQSSYKQLRPSLSRTQLEWWKLSVCVCVCAAARIQLLEPRSFDRLQESFRQTARKAALCVPRFAQIRNTHVNHKT